MKHIATCLLALGGASELISLTSPAYAANYGAVKVAGVSIKGLNQQEATRRLKRELAPKLKRRVRLTDGKTTVASTREHLGAELDIGRMLARAARQEKAVPLLLRVNEKELRGGLNRLAPRFSRPARNARPYIYGGRVRIRPDVAARSLNLGAAVPRLKQQMEEPTTALTFRVPVRTQAASITRDRFRGINAVLGTFSTPFNPARVKRTHNMSIAVRAIDGTLIPPGDVFSLNKTVGPRTQARGYRTAIVFKNGYQAPGIGGGVSQVTGTIFNAALVAGLPIETYRTHSRPVVYAPIGRDATVTWGSFDMKFRNDTKSPLYISYQRQGSRLVARILGAKKSEKVKVRVVAKTLGPHHKTAKLYRTYWKNGKKVRTEYVGSSVYKWKVGEWED